MAWGLGSLFIPIHGEFALIVASIISAGLIINDVAAALHESSKSGLDSLFHAYQDEISNSKVPLLNKHCHEMYSDQIAEDAQDLFDDIKGLGHDSWWEPGSWSFQWGNLCWRAVVPLHVKGFPIQLIESLVTLPDTLTETTRSQHRSTAKGYYKTVASAQDIITFYEEMLNADAADTMASGTPKYVIAEALTDGVYIPTQGQSEELTINLKYDQEKTLSFDHLYFRQSPTSKGLDWEALNAQSHELFQSDRT